MNEKKQKLFNEMIEAATAYMNTNTIENAEYDSVRKATEAYAEFSGISYEQAAKIALETIKR